MTDRALSECLALIEGKFVLKGGSERFTAAVQQMFAIVLMTLPDDLGRRAVQEALLTSPYVPDYCDIRAAAARLASPFPDADDAYAEMLHLVETRGLYARPHPDRPSVFLEGPPDFSHPLVARTVAHCGGWRMICNGEAQMQEGLAKQFKGAYQRNAERWIGEVADALALPPERRPAHRFPRWTPYALPTGWEEAPEMPPAPQPERPEAVGPMPDEISERLHRLGIGSIGRRLRAEAEPISGRPRLPKLVEMPPTEAERPGLPSTTPEQYAREEPRKAELRAQGEQAMAQEARDGAKIS